MSRESKLVKNTLILSIGTVIPKIANFIVLPILTGYLSKIEYGTYDLILVLCSLCLPAVTLQIQTSAFRFLIEFKDNEKKKTTVISDILIFLLPITIGTLIIMFLILRPYLISIKILICLYFFFDIYYSTCGQIVRGLLKNKVYATSAVICSITNLIFVVLFVYFFRMGLTGVLISLLISTALPVMYMIAAVELVKYVKKSCFDRRILKKLLSYSWPMVPNAMSMWVMNASDRLVISMFIGVEANAIYAVAKKIPNIVTIAQSTFTMAWQESASLASEDSDSGEYYSKMFDIVFSMMAGVMVLILACMPILFKLLVRGSYEEAYNQMPILVWGMFFFSLAAYFGGIYTAQKATKSVGITTLVAAAINLVTNIIMIKFIGLYAASISTLISYVFLVIYRMLNIRKYVNIKYRLKKILIVLCAILIACALSYIKHWAIYMVEFIYAVCLMFVLNKKIIVDTYKIFRVKLQSQ